MQSSHACYGYLVLVLQIPPPKTNMEPQNGGFEDDFPFQRGDFQVPADSLRGSRPAPCFVDLGDENPSHGKTPNQKSTTGRRPCKKYLIVLVRVYNQPFQGDYLSLGIQSYSQMMIAMSNHLRNA